MIWRRRQRPFDALQVVVGKVEGERDELKILVETTRKRTALCGRGDDLSREDEGNRPNIAVLRFCL